MNDDDWFWVLYLFPLSLHALLVWCPLLEFLSIIASWSSRCLFYPLRECTMSLLSWLFDADEMCSLDSIKLSKIEERKWLVSSLWGFGNNLADGVAMASNFADNDLFLTFGCKFVVNYGYAIGCSLIR
ncbi:hypothetical protein QVD17_03912 [Tagetes erecta]|uniref:Uncharacterized protein n=1 Tax=Tagetes erecta TaxID=13708 RepID=A0AAD8PA22_TARER|nr:hypothetical protein QVD17_03912 [Tagetes erecta]